jgi:uncharacterized damage-inducible protein DinB
MSNPADEPLADLFRHNLWANLRLLEACEALSDPQLDATVQGTFGSIRVTLTHLAGSEESYVARLTGEQFNGAIRAGEVLGLAELRSHLRRSGEALIELAQQASAIGSVRVAWGGSVWQVPPGVILAQAINHTTEHRTQINTIITQQGIEPPAIDGWAYVIANIPAEETGE